MSEPRLRAKGFEDKWSEKKLKELVDYRTSGLTIADAKDEGKFCLYDVNKRVGRIDEGGIDKDFVSIVKDGDAGRTRVLPAWSAVTSTLGALIPKEEKTADFINGLMQNTSFTSLKAGTAIQHVYFSEYGEEPHLVPETKEQQAIGETLKTMDEMIENARKELERLKQVKKASLSVMFPQEGETKPRVRFKGFTDDWEQRKLIDVCDYVDYRGKTPTKTESGIFLVTAKNVKDGYIDYSASQEYISENDYEEVMHRGKPELGDVLFTTEAPCGNVAQVNNPNIALAQRIIKYRGHKGVVDNTYLKHYLLSPIFQGILNAKSSGGTVQGIKGSILHQQEIKYPKFEEQEKIGHYLDNLDHLITLHQRELFKLERVKGALLAQMFAKPKQ